MRIISIKDCAINRLGSGGMSNERVVSESKLEALWVPFVSALMVVLLGGGFCLAELIKG